MNTRLLMMLRVNVSAPQNIGAVPHGTRRTAPLERRDVRGPRLRGTILPGGSADWLLLRADGVLEMDLRFTLRTDDGALISMRSFGLRHGPPEVIAAIGRGETVDPSTYYFRTMPRFETAHPAYSFLNQPHRRRQRRPPAGRSDLHDPRSALTMKDSPSNSRPLMVLRLATSATEEIGSTPQGTLSIFPVIGGSFEGERLRGKVLAGGGDWVTPGPTEPSSSTCGSRSRPTTAP